ncbi:MAG: hypothetical protein J2P50_02730 [Hyphomicrobiaceae bacterium]|nr:hypothetical protein [Hyphomicrobiaceae bacterium]
MKRPFLVIALACLALFAVAGIAVGELLPYLFTHPHAFRGRRAGSYGLSIWAILQNVSAVIGIASFAIQIVQWGRRRRS